MGRKKEKYWYKTDIYCCVLCGGESESRYRVYNIEERGTHYHQDACWSHF